MSRYAPFAAFISLVVIAFVQAEALPGPEAYFTIKDGHLSYQGKRTRIWGSQGNLVAKDYAHIDAEVKRFAALGFNGFRTLWWDIDIDRWEYRKGDLSEPDRRDYLFASLARNGVWVWNDTLNSALIKPAHADIIDDPTTREDWLNALGEKPVRRPLWIVWDRRGETGYIDQIKKILNHENRHTGFRWADDPVFFVWEITNEQWWLQRVWTFANHLALPAFFQRELYQQWNDWLRKKYGDDDALRKAWVGSLLPGEALAQSTVMLLPLANPTSAQAEVLGINIELFKDVTYGPRDFSRQRGADVVEFLTNLLLEHKHRVYAAIRSVGKSGIGISVVPVVFDTGYSLSPQTLYVNSFGDAVCVGAYIAQIALDPQQPHYPFKSNLTEPPRLAYDDPWLEQNRVIGKPTFVYENNILMPAKYRAEYPYLLAMLAAIQDWDVIDFHYYGHPEDDLLTSTQPFNKMLRPDNLFSCQGLQFKWDPVLVSAMMIAAEIFKNFAVAPPATPTQMTIGRTGLYDIDMVEWGKLNKMLAPTTYRYGLRVKFDMELPDPIKVVGPIEPSPDFLAPVIRPTDQLCLDWHRGILTMDAPSAKSACGFLPEKVAFKGGVEIGDFKINVPENMPYTRPGEERYVCFGLAAVDGKDLAESKKMLLSAVCTSFNTDMKMNTENWPVGNQFGRLVNYAAWGREMCTQLGRLPVLVARVGLTMKAPALAGAAYTLRDWHFNAIRQGKMDAAGTLSISADEPVFIVEIER